jgi:hypothetical protein
MQHPAIQHRWAIVPFTRGKGVEVGGAPAALFPHFKPVADSQGIAAASLDFVFVVGAIDSREQGQFYECIKPGGYMVQAVHDQLYVEQITETAMFTVPQEFPHPCACVVRYGGFGDSIQAANILPELKRQGFHVVFMTLPRGQDILKHDPHIDDWLLQDDDQVPNPSCPTTGRTGRRSSTSSCSCPNRSRARCWRTPAARTTHGPTPCAASTWGATTSSGRPSSPSCRTRARRCSTNRPRRRSRRSGSSPSCASRPPTCR